MRTFAACILALAAAAVGGEAVKYEPNWASLDARPIPQWYRDAKFGIFIHWGVYSVPAWAPKGQYAEWYWNHMQNKNGATWKHHAATYGADFKYEQFAPMFKAEKYDPDAWAELFEKSGARYVVPTSKHHDGYCLWPSAQAKDWNAMDVGPKRDLLGDLTTAVRKRGLKMGFYYSLYEWYNPLYRSDVKRYAAEHMLPQLKDAVTRYAPAIIFSDGEWDQSDTTWRSEEFLAWLYNESPCREDVVVDDRWGRGTRGRHGGYYTSEYGDRGGKVRAHVWEECQGVGASFGYNRNEGPQDYKTTKQLLQLLINCVSGGGNLLLDIGPDADGTIPQIMQDRLLDMGKWLKANGESIHGASAGPLRNLPWGRSTAKPGTLYLHVYQWPQNGELEVPGLDAKVTGACLLADAQRAPLAVRKNERGTLAVAVPREAPDPNVNVIVVKYEGEIQASEGRPAAQAADGTIALRAADATIHGDTARYESDGGKDNIGYWTDAADTVSWKLAVVKPGEFDVEIAYACDKGSGGGEFTIAVEGGQPLSGTVKETGSWTQFTTERLGTLKLDKAGQFTLTVKPTKKPGLALMNLKAITLRPK